MDIETFAERRKHERVPFIEHIRIDGIRRVRSTDISKEGLYVSSVQSLEIDTVVEVAIPVNGQTLTVKAKVAFHDSRVGFGLIFVDLNDTQKTTIEKLIQRALEKCSYSG